MRSALSVAAIGGMLALSACGDDKSESSEPKVTNEQAITQIAEVRNRLAKAVKEAKAGREAAADDLVSQAYVEQFEKVEGPLEKADAKLNEKLEDAIREKLRETIKAGKADEAEDLVAQINRDLTLAQGKLARQ